MSVACDPSSLYNKLYHRSSSESELAQGQSILNFRRDDEVIEPHGGTSVERERVVLYRVSSGGKSSPVSSLDEKENSSMSFNGINISSDNSNY